MNQNSEVLSCVNSSLHYANKTVNVLTPFSQPFPARRKDVMFENVDKQFWKTVIDTMHDGLMLVDPEGKILFVNKAFEKLMGYDAAELIGLTCEIFHCDRCFQARAKGLDKYCALFREEGVRCSECIFRKKDGSFIHLLKNASLIRNHQGKVIGGLETLVDLSNVVAKEKEIATLKQQLHYNEGFQGIIGNSPVMRRVFDLVESVARSEASIIIYGESGTGKELIASAIHCLSKRHKQPFIKVNCAALNESLLESELFGHVKGAFTGADHTRIGRFEAASGGSIFLDEIGDLPLNTQTKLLRVLQERELERVGDHRPIAVDVRVIAATHKNLRQLIRQGLFREDLYYRIGVIPIHLPPLRERKADIPLLIEIFRKRLAGKTGKKIAGISKDALDLLANYSWPGNVRELLNTLEYAFVLCPGGRIGLPRDPDAGTIGSTALPDRSDHDGGGGRRKTTTDRSPAERRRQPMQGGPSARSKPGNRLEKDQEIWGGMQHHCPGTKMRHLLVRPEQKRSVHDTLFFPGGRSGRAYSANTENCTVCRGADKKQERLRLIQRICKSGAGETIFRSRKRHACLSRKYVLKKHPTLSCLPPANGQNGRMR